MCEHCDSQSDTGSSFIFGIFLGAIIGAVVAIYIYKNNRSDVFGDLKDKLQKYFSKFMDSPPKTPKKKSQSSKITVTIPKSVESIDLTPPRRSPPQKMFVKK
ncbi:YtxH domain-containing protein [Candidatus Shapirobacteria bacterium]|nr:YtxH domain-containing protein [Candidatus Shapirobacteria bacterium]